MPTTSGLDAILYIESRLQKQKHRMNFAESLIAAGGFESFVGLLTTPGTNEEARNSAGRSIKHLCDSSVVRELIINKGLIELLHHLRADSNSEVVAFVLSAFNSLLMQFPQHIQEHGVNLLTICEVAVEEH
jgi:hypothetical protein